MNTKFEFKVSQKQLDSWLWYHAECGYVVRKESHQGETVWYSTAPGYGNLTPAAILIQGSCTSRFIYVRLAEKSLT